MAQRITLFPPTLRPENSSIQKLYCKLNFEDLGDSLVGQSVRLIIYDEDLYAASGVGQSEGDDLQLFRNDGTLSGSQLDPPISGDNGVLAKLDGVLRKTEHKKWGFAVQKKVLAPHPGSPLFELRVLDEKEFIQSICIVAYPKSVPTIPGSHEYLFRVALVSSGRILASNINPNHTPAPIPLKVIQDAREDDDNTVIGGEPVSADPSMPLATPDPTPRSSGRDLTGFYESFSLADNEHPALMFQMNQAGHTLVGWFTPPPSFVQPVSRLTGISIPPGQNQVILQPGVFVAFLENAMEDGWFLFKWRAQPEFRANNELDPDDINMSVATTGRLRIVEADHGVFQRLYIQFDVKAADQLELLRTSTRTRWSRSEIDLMEPDAVRASAIRTHVQPIPTTFWNQLAARFQSGADGKAATTLGTLIQKWSDAGNDFDKMAIESPLSRELDMPGLDGPYGEVIRSRLLAFAAGNKLTLNVPKLLDQSATDTRSYLEWLQIIAGQEDSGEEVVARYGRSGVVPEGRFKYTMEFSAVGIQGTLFLKAGLFGFLANVKGEMEEGQAPGFPWDTKQAGLTLAGVFVEVGTGIGAGLGGKSLPEEVEFVSKVPLTPNDFLSGWFRIVALKGPSAAAILETGASVAEGTQVQLQLQNAFLVGEVSKGPHWNGPELPTTNEDLKELKDKLKELKKGELKVEVTIAELTAGFGKIFSTNDPVLIRHPLEAPALDKDDKHVVRRTTRELFAVDSFSIDSAGTSTGSARLELERYLAIERALFDSSENARVAVRGYASPENTKEHNRALSINRARVVAQAIRDALGTNLRAKIEIVTGLGETPATDPTIGGLTNPPDGPAEANWEKLHAEEVAQWPDWRRVDVDVESNLVLRVKAEP